MKQQAAWLRFSVRFALAGLMISSAPGQSGASYTARRTVDAVTVDGNLNEQSWAGAASSSVFTVWDGSTAPAALQTSARMVWDDDYLYVGFNARDPDMYGTYTGRDVHCWEQDAFEVFVTVPGTTGYLEMDGNLSGGFWDGYFTDVFQGPGGSYTITNLLIAAHAEGTRNNSSDRDLGFTAEFRIPFAQIYHGIPGGHPTNGTQLRLNLNRINWNTPATLGGAGATGTDTYYAWSPEPGSSPSFHRPAYFGTVTFSTNAVAAPVITLTPQVLSGTNLVLSGLGQAGGAYRILVSTNASLPAANWGQVATNRFDYATRHFSLTNAIDPGSPQLFYRVQSP